MKRLFIMLVFAVLTIFFVLPITAQETTAECDLQAVNESIAVASDTIITGDVDASLASLLELETLILTTRASCTGLVFSSTVEGNMPVIGPVTIPAGLYRARATTQGFLIVDVTAIQGECGEGTDFLYEGLFNLSAGEANQGAEVLFTSRDCQALIAFDNVSEPPWTLEFERIADAR